MSAAKAAQQCREVLQSIKEATYISSDATSLSSLCATLKDIQGQFDKTLPKEKGLIINDVNSKHQSKHFFVLGFS